MDRKRKQAFTRKYCLHPTAPNGCSPTSGAAHTVQRALIVRHLAEKQHVIRFEYDTNPRLSGMLVKPEKVGVNKATTFYGFCQRHDNDLFRPLETEEFTFGEEQIALLGFRAFSKDVYGKEAELDFNEMVIDHLRKQADKRVSMVELRNLYLKNARRSLREAWSKFGQMVTSCSTQSLRYWSVLFDSVPIYFACSTHLPEWDFDGNAIQSALSLNRSQGLAFSSLAAGGQSAAVFCWHESDDTACLPFIRSLARVEHSRLANRIISMAFEIGENVIFRETWWRKLSRRDKDLIMRRVPSGFAMERTAYSFADHGLNAVQTQVVEVRTNVAL